MNYQLYTGCVIPARLPFIESSSRKIFERLGISTSDIKGFSCCPDPTGMPALDETSWLAMGARNLCIAKNNGGNVLSLCSGCTETLKTVDHMLEADSKKREEINKILSKIGKQYVGSINIKHFAQVLYENLDKIEKEIVKPLEGFKVACHYGCHYLRPSNIIKWDDPFNPTTLDEIVKTLGAESIQYDLKMECCGYPVEKTDEDLSRKMIENKFDSISKTNANCIAVVCPACYIQHDFKQRSINQKEGTNYNFPVLYLSELVALALGFSDKEIGLNYHSTKVKPLLEDIEFVSI